MSFSNLFLEVGARIAELRGDLTQAEFAIRLDVDRKTIGRWEAGERLPDGGSLLKLMREFEADVNYILTGIDSESIARLRSLQEGISKAVDSSQDYQTVVAGSRARSANERREIEILKNFRLADEAGKKHIEATTKMVAKLKE